MKLKKIVPNREFKVGLSKNNITIKHALDLYLNDNEQVTLKKKFGNKIREYDVCAKDWGYYALPSINSRLKKNNFTTFLISNSEKRLYVWIVENSKKKEFLKYLNYENQNIVANLSDKKIYNLLTKENKPILKKTNHFCIGGCNYKLKKKLNKKPKNELPLNINKPYYREIHKCENCGHFINISFLNNIKNYYEGKYVANTYGDINNINRLFKSIISLPKNKSDNKNRVERINFFFKNIQIHNNFKVLDIGSGLGVFLYELNKQTNWQCYGLDPDKLQSMHMNKFLNIKNFNSTLENYTSKLKYDLITINKVLEHQKDPLKFLKQSIKNLKNKGFIYLEVPDGEYASKYGVSIIENEEFFIEHFHIFSLLSIIKLIEKTNLRIVNTQRIKEPSGKFTLICLCKNF